MVEPTLNSAAGERRCWTHRVMTAPTGVSLHSAKRILAA
jgi:hypothetical protein